MFRGAPQRGYHREADAEVLGNAAWLHTAHCAAGASNKSKRVCVVLKVIVAGGSCKETNTQLTILEGSDS